MKGNQGVLHFVDSDEDLNWLIDKGKHAPYIPLLNSSMFTRYKKIILKLRFHHEKCFC